MRLVQHDDHPSIDDVLINLFHRRDRRGTLRVRVEGRAQFGTIEPKPPFHADATGEPKSRPHLDQRRARESSVDGKQPIGLGLHTVRTKIGVRRLQPSTAKQPRPDSNFDTLNRTCTAGWLRARWNRETGHAKSREGDDRRQSHFG
jgi:hypothetical protein